MRPRWPASRMRRARPRPCAKLPPDRIKAVPLRAAPAAVLAGFAIVTPPTTAAFWEREIFVGNVTQYTFENVSVDDVVFGVKAIDKDGHESVVTPWVNAPPASRKPI